MKYEMLSVFWLIAMSEMAMAETCHVKNSETFVPENKIVHLVNHGGGPDLIFFKSSLHVNTDGAPNSYHPEDLRGTSKAINNIVNGVAISRTDGKPLSYSEKIATFEKFRDAKWQVPSGYQITWQNVIAGTTADNRTIPCIFQSGDFKGYFGSVTSLKNGLASTQRGECESLNQIDERFVPGLVLALGKNPVIKFGAKKGDLIFAYNPGNGVASAAVIADRGPPDRLGEGSVALNMKLLKRTDQPKNYEDAKSVDTEGQDIDVIVIPNSAAYRPAKPFTATNIAERLTAWQKANGIDLRSLASACETVN